MSMKVEIREQRQARHLSRGFLLLPLHGSGKQPLLKGLHLCLELRQLLGQLLGLGYNALQRSVGTGGTLHDISFHSEHRCKGHQQEHLHLRLVSLPEAGGGTA